MSTTFLALLGQTATILRAAKKPSGFGGSALVDDWTTATSTTSLCRLQQSGGTERTDLRDLSVTTWKLFLPAAADITEHDRVTVDGKTFEVVSVYPVHTPAGEHHKECVLETFSGGVPS